MQYVYVLNKHGEPLMPCSPRKARLLLKQKKACVIKRTPFTVKLLYGSTGYNQPVTLGVDAGSKHIGISATTEKHELYREEATPRNDVVDLLSARRAFRRSRRNRKTRYRAPRFDNRVNINFIINADASVRWDLFIFVIMISMYIQNGSRSKRCKKGKIPRIQIPAGNDQVNSLKLALFEIIPQIF